MRPKAIVTFEQLFLLSIGMSVAQLALFAFEGDVGAGVLGLGAFLAALPVVLVLLTSRKRSNLARWVLVVLTLFGIYSAAVGLGEGEPVDAAAMIGWAALALQAAAVALLFAPSAGRWFSGEDKVVRR